MYNLLYIFNRFIVKVKFCLHTINQLNVIFLKLYLSATPYLQDYLNHDFPNLKKIDILKERRRKGRKGGSATQCDRLRPPPQYRESISAPSIRKGMQQLNHTNVIHRLNCHKYTISQILTILESYFIFHVKPPSDFILRYFKNVPPRVIPIIPFNLLN